MKTKNCRRCGYDMRQHPFHICPQCGKFFAFYTPAQATLLLVGSAIAGVLVSAVLVVLLWRFS